MDLESPDWDRSPSLIEETRDDPYLTPAVKQEDIKLEDVKQEDPSPTALVLSTPRASTTLLPPPPPKSPPILPPPYRNLSTRTTSTQPPPRSTTKHTGRKPHPPPPPPSTSSSTSSEDPVILTTNVPILQKSRPGQPPLRLRPQPNPQATPLTSPPLPTQSSSSNMRSPPLPTHRQAQVTIPRPGCNGKILPFNFSSHILHYLDPVNAPSRQPFTFQSRSTVSGTTSGIFSAQHSTSTTACTASTVPTTSSTS